MRLLRLRIACSIRPVLAALAVCAMAGTASAQDKPHLPAPRVAVLPFVSSSGAPDRMLGRRASDAAWAALQNQESWEVVDPHWLLRLCETEDARAPFAVGHLQMFGHRVRAPLAIIGLVENFNMNADRGIAQVTLGIELVETLAGTRLATARGVASAKREEGEVFGQTVDRALMEAAGDAVRDLTSFDPLTAIVVATLPDGRVMLDGPLDPRIKAGSKLLIYRGGRTGPAAVGTVEVRTSSLSVLHAQPTSGRDFRQGDRAVLVAR